MPAGRKGRLEREQELAAYYQAHKEDGEWERVEVERPSKVGAVYSIRFTPAEFEGLRSLADREGKRISQVVREAVNDYISDRRQRQENNIIVTRCPKPGFLFFRTTGSVMPSKTTSVAAKIIWGTLQHQPSTE